MDQTERNYARPNWVRGTRWIADLLLWAQVIDPLPCTYDQRIALCLEDARQALDRARMRVLDAQRELAEAQADVRLCNAQITRLTAQQTQVKRKELKAVAKIAEAR